MDMYEKKKIAELLIRDAGNSVTRDSVREYLDDEFSFDTAAERDQVVEEIYGLVLDAEVIVFWNIPADLVVTKEDPADVADNS